MSYLKRKPLVRFDNSERAALVPSMPPTTRRGRRRTRTSTKTSKNRRPRVVKGRLNLRIAGFPGIQRLSASSLVPFLPLNKLKAAAKRVLNLSGHPRSRRNRRKTRNQRGRKQKL